MAQVLWQPNARTRLRRITIWLQRVAPNFAAKWRIQFSDAIHNIAMLPIIGEQLEGNPSAEVELREIILNPYRLIYRFDGSTCWILCILDRPKQFARELGCDDLFL